MSHSTKITLRCNGRTFTTTINSRCIAVAYCVPVLGAVTLTNDEALAAFGATMGGYSVPTNAEEAKQRLSEFSILNGMDFVDRQICLAMVNDYLDDSMGIEPDVIELCIKHFD